MRSCAGIFEDVAARVALPPRKPVIETTRLGPASPGDTILSDGKVAKMRRRRAEPPLAATVPTA